MIKALIFDCFDVVVEDSLNVFYAKYLADEPDKVAQVKLLDKRANNSQATFDDVIAKAAELAGVSEEEARKFLEFRNGNRANVPLLQYIRETLKPHYKIGFLSNVSGDWLEDLLTSEQRTLFDDFVLSFQVGVAKPEAAIYEIAADRLNVRYDECIFIDDREDYCNGARAVGMQAIQYIGFNKFKTDLETLLLAPNHV